MVRTGLFYLTSLHWFLADDNTKLIFDLRCLWRGEKKKKTRTKVGTDASSFRDKVKGVLT